MDNLQPSAFVQTISGRDCVRYKNTDKWIPQDKVSRLSALYDSRPDIPDYIVMSSVCARNSFSITDPFETFLCGYIWEGGQNTKQTEYISNTQTKLVDTLAEVKVLKQKLEMTEGQLNQLSTEYATFRNNVSQSDWQRAINEKDAMIAQLQEYINNAQRECQYQWNLNNEQHNNEIRKKNNEINELKSKHLDESVHVKEVHINELNEKDKQIVALQEHLNQTLGELQKARSNATNGIQNLLDQSVQKELQMANTLTTFKQAAWSLLERVLTSYDNTLSFIENVCIAVQDCQRIVRALWDNNDNNINNRFSRVSIPNVSQDKEAVQQFKNQYLQDIDQEVQMMKNKYQFTPNSVMYLTNNQTQSQ